MVFSSISFIFFLLPVFLLADFVFRKWVRMRNFAVIIFSLLFYTWGEGLNVMILVLLGGLTFFAGTILWRSEGRKQKYCLFLFVAIALLILIGYKYLYWMLGILVQCFPTLADIRPLDRFASPVTQIPPLGISFFTFHSISYLVDIYRRKITDKPVLSEFLCYFFMFPHLVAGPIVRYVNIQHDLGHRGPDRTLFEYGVVRFLIGLNKKVLIANSVAPLADLAFSMNTGKLCALDAWLGLLAYTVQIYFDFSGYSDMAIGLAAMMGFHFHENFNSPYKSKSIREFWRRWHISLSTWLRDYLFIPLGGSRGSEIRTYFNLFVVFVLCGLWHGAQMTFLVWGLFHGFFMMLERLGLGDWLEKKAIAPVAHVYCMLVVMASWVLFRATSFDQVTGYFAALFCGGFGQMVIPLESINLIALAAGIWIALFPVRSFSVRSSHEPGYPAIPYAVNVVFALLSCVFLFVSARNPFIYFNF